jgi:hypothetical protein
MDREPLSWDHFMKVLGPSYKKLKGKFDGAQFKSLLEQMNFEEDSTKRTILQALLEIEGFFKPDVSSSAMLWKARVIEPIFTFLQGYIKTKVKYRRYCPIYI